MAFNTDNYNIIFEAYKNNAIKLLQEEYNAGRLTGADYANALVQALTNIVIEASKAEQEQEKLEADTKLALSKLVKENELKDAQIKKTIKEIDAIDNNLKLAYMKTEKELEKMTHEISKIDAEIKVALEKLNLERQKLGAEIALKNAEAKLKNKQYDLAVEELNFKKSIDPKLVDLKQKEIDLAKKNIDLADAQLDLERAKIQDIKDQKYLNMFSKQMDAWSLMFTTGLLEDKPSIISDDRVTELYNYLADYQ